MLQHHIGNVQNINISHWQVFIGLSARPVPVRCRTVFFNSGPWRAQSVGFPAKTKVGIFSDYSGPTNKIAKCPISFRTVVNRRQLNDVVLNNVLLYTVNDILLHTVKNVVLHTVNDIALHTVNSVVLHTVNYVVLYIVNYVVLHTVN